MFDAIKRYLLFSSNIYTYMFLKRYPVKFDKKRIVDLIMHLYNEVSKENEEKRIKDLLK